MIAQAHPRRPRIRLPIRSRLIILVVVALLALAGGGYLWLRDSSLVAVQKVSIVGVSGADAGAIRSALRAAAQNMTTLDVRIGTLRAAVSPYPVVKGVEVATEFPHGMRIRVTEQTPVASIQIGSRSLAVSADGTILTDVSPSPSLPPLTLRAAPGGSRIEDRSALEQLSLLAAAPAALLGRITSVKAGYWHGIVLGLRRGPSLYFGDASQAAAKWRAAVAMLALKQSQGAAYIDVSDPGRPAAGTGSATTAGGATPGGGA